MGIVFKEGSGILYYRQLLNTLPPSALQVREMAIEGERVEREGDCPVLRRRFPAALPLPLCNQACTQSPRNLPLLHWPC